MLFLRLLTQHPSEAMHVQGNDSQSNTSGKSLSTFRPNTVEATVFKIVDGRLHSGVLTAHSSKRFTLFAFPISLAEAALFGQDVVNKYFIKAGAVRGAVEAAIKTRSAEIRKQFLRDFDQRYCEIDITAGPHNFVMALFVKCRECPCAIYEIVIESTTNGRIREISQWITRNIRIGYQE